MRAQRAKVALHGRYRHRFSKTRVVAQETGVPGLVLSISAFGRLGLETLFRKNLGACVLPLLGLNLPKVPGLDFEDFGSEFGPFLLSNLVL